LLAGNWADDELANYQAEAANIGGSSTGTDLRFLYKAYNDTEKAAIAEGARFGVAVVREFENAAAGG
jgi:hypothetical protein